MSLGLTFKGIHSSTYHLVMKSSNRQALSSVTRYTKQVPGYTGLIDFGNDTYTEVQKVVTLQYNYHLSMPELIETTEKVTVWLYNDGEYHDLTFDDAPTRVYKAKVISQIDISPNNSLVGISVTFACNPPWPYLNGILQTPEEITWQTAAKDGNQYMQEFTTSGHMRFSNIGTLLATPKIKLLNNIPSGLKLTYSGDSWQYDASLANDGIIIDSSNQSVTRASDGHNLYQNVNPTKDTYFYFAPGQINIDITVTGLGTWPNNLIIIVEFTPQGVG